MARREPTARNIDDLVELYKRSLVLGDAKSLRDERDIAFQMAQVRAFLIDKGKAIP